MNLTNSCVVAKITVDKQVRNPMIRSFILLLILMLAGCSKPSTPPTPPAICKADPVWIASPSMPTEVPKDESFCDFYQFSWQWMLAQISPSGNGEPVFMQNRIYSPTGGTDQCANAPITGVKGASGQLIPRQGKPIGFEDVQADGHALYDQRSNVLLYNAFYSQALCSSTVAGFAPGTLEMKVSWMVLPEGVTPTHYTIRAQPQGHDKEVTLGLVGLHMAIWTPNHPEMIWASWEHKANAPLCNGSSAKTGWSLTSDTAAACLAANPTGVRGAPPSSCDSFEFNTPPTNSSTVPVTGAPINVCRQYAQGNQAGTAVNGNDNAANLAAITELNAAFVGEAGLLTKLPVTNPMQVWSNYEMVGSLWTKGGGESGPPPVPSTQTPGPGDAASPQRGSLEMTNMTLETFQQGDKSFVPNCFGCHNYTKANPLNVSHLQDELLPKLGLRSKTKPTD